MSYNMAMDCDGNLLMRMGENMAVNMDSGELHLIFGWSKDKDED